MYMLCEKIAAKLLTIFLLKKTKKKKMKGFVYF